jgi:hypothetical protein
MAVQVCNFLQGTFELHSAGAVQSGNVDSTTAVKCGLLAGAEQILIVRFWNFSPFHDLLTINGIAVGIRRPTGISAVLPQEGPDQLHDKNSLQRTFFRSFYCFL